MAGNIGELFVGLSEDNCILYIAAEGPDWKYGIYLKESKLKAYIP